MQLNISIIGFVFLMIGGCTQFEREQRHSPITEIEQAQAIWNRLSLPSYEFTMQRNCYCLPDYVQPIRVTIQSGKVVSARYVENNIAVTENVAKTVKTIAEWLEYIALRKEQNPHQFEVIYDGQYGLPTYFKIDRSERIADDTEEVWIRDFLVLK